jgi:phospholipase C
LAGISRSGTREKEEEMSRLLTRREALRGGAAVGASAFLANSLISRALATAPACGTLKDIKHVVTLVQENRSFDHYFGSYRGVTGFADPNALPLSDSSGLNVFAQPGYPGGYKRNHLYPFHLDSYKNGECTNDINHSWAPQHAYWDNGAMDGFVKDHLQVDGSANGAADHGLLQPRRGLGTYGPRDRRASSFPAPAVRGRVAPSGAAPNKRKGPVPAGAPRQTPA